MAGNQAPSVSNIDNLFMQAVNDPAVASHTLDTFGPQINIWPSGYRTLGFGGEDNEGTPAAAMALAAVGAIAVRAAAGESDAAPAYSTHSSQMALSLKSTTMESALRSMRQGRGLIATMAIAANMSDRRSEPNVADTLMSDGALGSLLGESIQDVLSGSKDGNREVNALYYTNRSTVISEARGALHEGVSRYFNMRIADGHLSLYTYAELARRTNAMAHPNSPSSRLWLGALVEAGDEVSDQLTSSQELQHIVHPEVFKLYNLAIDRGISGRPRGVTVSGGIGKGVPSRQRTMADAVRLGVTKGAKTARPGTGLAPVGETSVDTSYTGRRAAVETGSHNRRYLEILQRGLAKYVDCRQAVQEDLQRRRAKRAHVHAALSEVFGDHPYLHPANLTHITDAERDLPVLVREGDIGQVVAGTMELARQRPADAQTRIARRVDLGNGVAAASLLRLDSAEAQTTYRKLMLNPSVRAAASWELEANINLLIVQNVDHLPPDLLDRYGLQPGEASRQFPLASLTRPPVHLLVMAADVINTNASSVLPLGRPVRLRGRSAAELKAQKGTYGPAGNRYAKTTWRQRWREQQEAAAAVYEEQKERVDSVTDTVRMFIEDRYGVPVDNDNRLLGFLTECVIAEEVNFMSAPPAIQSRIARRLYRAANRNNFERRGGLQPASLPTEVRPIYERAMAIIQSESGNRSGSILSRWLDAVFGPAEDY